MFVQEVSGEPNTISGGVQPKDKSVWEISSEVRIILAGSYPVMEKFVQEVSSEKKGRSANGLEYIFS